MFVYEDDPTQLVRSYNAFVFGPDVPPSGAEQMQTILGAADTVTKGLEYLWAHFDALTEQGLILVGQFASYAVAHLWTQVNAGGRCEGMIAAVHREMGDPGEWPPREDDPPPLDWALPPAPPVPAPPPPPVEAVEAAAKAPKKPGRARKPRKAKSPARRRRVKSGAS